MDQQATYKAPNGSRRRFLALGLAALGSLCAPRDVSGRTTAVLSGAPVKPSRKWTVMLARHHAQAGASHPGDRKWCALLDALGHLPADDRILSVNKAVNAVPYCDDMSNYAVTDHWATPREFLHRGGDCEDFAITKYLALLHSGSPEDRLRIIVARRPGRPGTHAVAAVQRKAEWYVLDSLNAEPLPLETRADLRPVYSISGSSRWIHTASQT